MKHKAALTPARSTHRATTVAARHSTTAGLEGASTGGASLPFGYAESGKFLMLSRPWSTSRPPLRYYVLASRCSWLFHASCITHLGETSLPRPTVDTPVRLRLNRLKERVAQPLRELVEGHKVVALLALAGTGAREGRAWPHIAKDLVRGAGECRTRWPDRSQEGEQRVPEQAEREDWNAAVALELRLEVPWCQLAGNGGDDAQRMSPGRPSRTMSRRASRASPS